MIELLLKISQRAEYLLEMHMEILLQLEKLHLT